MLWWQKSTKGFEEKLSKTTPENVKFIYDKMKDIEIFRHLKMDLLPKCYELNEFNKGLWQRIIQLQSISEMTENIPSGKKLKS
jgi:hypothetical protein